MLEIDKIKKLYREIENIHHNKPYNSLAKSIDVVLKNEELDDLFKLEVIKTYIDDYFEELKYVDESEYL